MWDDMAFAGFTIDGLGGDGMAFLLATPVIGGVIGQAIGVGDGTFGLGYGGIDKSVAVEYDTFSSSEVDPADPDNPDAFNGNHVGIDVNGSLVSAAVTPIATRLNDGNPLFSWVDYDATAKRLEVRLSSTDVKPATANLSYAIDLAAALGKWAFLGFSGATGTALEEHAVSNFQLAQTEGSTPPPPPPTNVPALTYGYTYDANSRITGVTNFDGTVSYTYDDTDQLTGANYSSQPDESFTYDANGNRTNAGYRTGLNNRLLSDGTFNYEYDNEGNLTKQTDILTGEVTQYTWDYRNRLTNVSRNGTPVGSYTYDTYDQRIGKTAGANTDRFVYGQNQNIALEFDGGGTQTHRYLHGNRIDQILADETNGSVGWTLTDNLGSVRDAVDATGTNHNHVVFGSFGNVTSETNPSFNTRFSFTGREFDAETGNYDYRNRPYNPRSGRFIEEDAIRFSAGDPNLYRYVGNSPANWIDPSGNVKIELVFNPLVRGQVTTYPLVRGTLVPDYTNPIHRDVSVNHAFVLVTDLDGTQKYYRGEPEIVPFEEQLARGDSGPIVTEFDTYPTKRNGVRSIDAINPSLQIRKVVYENKCEPASLYEPRLIRSLARTEASYLKYFILGPNSNSVAYQLLKDIGMSTSLPGGVSAPGWGIDLNTNYLEKYSPPNLIDTYLRTNIGPGPVRPKNPPPDYSNYRPDVNWDTLIRIHEKIT